MQCQLSLQQFNYCIFHSTNVNQTFFLWSQFLTVPQLILTNNDPVWKKNWRFKWEYRFPSKSVWRKSMREFQKSQWRLALLPLAKSRLDGRIWWPYFSHWKESPYTNIGIGMLVFNANKLCRPHLSIPFLVRRPILHNVIVHRCCCLPSLLLSNAPIFCCHSHHHHPTVSAISHCPLLSFPIAARRPITRVLFVHHRCHLPPLSSGVCHRPWYWRESYPS